MYQQKYFESFSYCLQTSWRLRTLAAVSIVVFASPLVFGDSELYRSRFLKEYQPHADSIQESYSNIIVDFIMIYNAGTTEQVQHVTGKFNRWHYLLSGKSKQVQKDTQKIRNRSLPRK